MLLDRLPLPAHGRDWRLGLAVSLSLVMGACSAKESSPPSGSPNASSDTALATEAAPASPAAPPAGGSARAEAKGATPAPKAYIAETHAYRFGPPVKALKTLWQKHLDACHTLGPNGCMVEKAEISTGDDGFARSATLAIRVANTQAGTYLARLDADAPRGHEIERADKTTEVIDTEARLANKRQLLARLQALRNATGRLTDIVDLETQISDVQTEIESAQGQREFLRQQTEKTRIDLSYTADGRALDVQTWQPVHDAVANIGPTLAATIGFLIYALTFLTPIALVLGLVWWITRLARRKAPFPATPPAPPPAPPSEPLPPLR